MAFDNHYPNRKDHRKPYRKGDSRSVDRSCRAGGDCPWCRNGKEHYRRLDALTAAAAQPQQAGRE